jgi:hypothetical protein
LCLLLLKNSRNARAVVLNGDAKVPQQH